MLAFRCLVAALAAASDRTEVCKREQQVLQLGEVVALVGATEKNTEQKVKIIAAHASLSSSALQIQSYPSLEAFESSDKDDAVARRVVQSWKACNELSLSLEQHFDTDTCKLLTSMKEQGWGVLEGLVKHKQKKVDEIIATLREELRAKAKGGEGGESWKARLEGQTATFEDIVPIAEVLWSGGKGSDLQNSYKKLTQARLSAAFLHSRRTQKSGTVLGLEKALLQRRDEVFAVAMLPTMLCNRSCNASDFNRFAFCTHLSCRALQPTDMSY